MAKKKTKTPLPILADNEVLFEIYEKPDHEGKHSFMFYWKDSEGGTRGQVFRAYLYPSIQREEGRGRTVSVKDLTGTYDPCLPFLTPQKNEAAQKITRFLTSWKEEKRHATYFLSAKRQLIGYLQAEIRTIENLTLTEYKAARLANFNLEYFV
jgi:hypothetical protein